jgi:hypothetical protein
MAEQDLPFNLVFDQPGRQVIEARVDSMAGESDYADNVRAVTVDVRPGRVRVAYVTDRPGTDTRMILRALASDERIEVAPDVAVTGGLAEKWGKSRPGTMSDERGTMNVPQPDVFILDDVAETGSPDVWQSIAGRVRAGAGALVLAGPYFQPGRSIGEILNGSVGRAQTGSFTPDLTAEGRLLPWWVASSSQAGSEVVDLSRVPPFAGLRSLEAANHAVSWLVSQENGLSLMDAGKAGKGKYVYVAVYPLWRWGFGPEENPEQGSPLSVFLSGVVRYLAERDTSPFWLDVDRQNLYRGQPVRLVLKAVAPDGRPWSGLSAAVRVAAESAQRIAPESGRQSQRPETVTMPMTEAGGGVYEAVIEALAPGRYRATASVSTADTLLGRTTTEFAVVDQPVELANTGLNEGLLRAMAGAGGGRFYAAESLPGEGSAIVLGTYQRRFTFDPRRAVWAYVLIVLLAGAEWLLRRRRGML